MTTVTDPDSEERQRPVECEATLTSARPSESDLDGRIEREQTEALLDEALRETFPASDPVAITPQKRDSK